jgi:hypothetical protein
LRHLDGIDPIEEVKELVTKEAMIYSVGCEPAINSFVNARSFMKAVADLTGMPRVRGAKQMAN